MQIPWWTRRIILCKKNSRLGLVPGLFYCRGGVEGWSLVKCWFARSARTYRGGHLFHARGWGKSMSGQWHAVVLADKQNTPHPEGWRVSAQKIRRAVSRVAAAPPQSPTLPSATGSRCGARGRVCGSRTRFLPSLRMGTRWCSRIRSAHQSRCQRKARPSC